MRILDFLHAFSNNQGVMRDPSIWETLIDAGRGSESKSEMEGTTSPEQNREGKTDRFVENRSITSNVKYCLIIKKTKRIEGYGKFSKYF